MLVTKDRFKGEKYNIKKNNITFLTSLLIVGVLLFCPVKVKAAEDLANEINYDEITNQDLYIEEQEETTAISTYDANENEYKLNENENVTNENEDCFIENEDGTATSSIWTEGSVPPSIYRANNIVSLYFEGELRYKEAYEVLRLINIERKKGKLTPLKMDASLQKGAMKRAAESNVDFSHTRPNGQSCFTILKEVGHNQYGYVGENIAAGHKTPQDVVKGWMNSPGHKANIMNPRFKSMGVGVFSQGKTNYWSQLFSDANSSTDYKNEKNVPIKYAIQVTDKFNVGFHLYSEDKPTVLTEKPLQLEIGIMNPFTKMRFMNYASISSDSVDWKSSNPKVATINKNGLITGVQNGSTQVTAAVKNFKKWTFTLNLDVKLPAPPKLIVTDTVMTAGTNFNPKTDIKYQATDYLGANLNDKVKVVSSNVNIKKEGSYKVVYSVTDKLNKTTTKQITVMVKAENPVIVTKNIVIKQNLNYNQKEGLLRATDKVDGVITDRVVVSKNTVDKTKPGTYEIHYSVTNSNKKQTNQVIKVTVEALKPPTLDVKDTKIEAKKSFDPLKEINYQAKDEYGVNLHSAVKVVDDKVNIKKEGTYPLTFSVTDARKMTTKKTIKVIVTPTHPVIEAKDFSILLGSKLDPKAGLIKVTDKVDGDLKAKTTVIKNTVNINKAGQYIIQYAVKNSNNRQTTKQVKVTVCKTPDVLYTTHVQNIGWQKYFQNGQMAGTTGRGLRLEGIKIKLNNFPNSGIKYSTHVQNIGWQSFVENDKLSGTSGQSKRLEAIKISLTGEIATKYDVHYRVHAQNFGWLGWTKNGAASGTEGFGYRLEGIEIKLVEKGKKGPSDTKPAFKKKETPPSVSYSTHIQNVGWQGKKKDGQLSGTTGRALRLEGIKLNLENNVDAGNIEYKTHVQNIGWQNFVKNNAMSGTSGRSLRLEAIQIKLTGKMAEKYDIYYQVHAQNFGWLDWAKNGQSSGTAGYSYRLEGIKVKLVKKGEKAPGKTGKAFVSK